MGQQGLRFRREWGEELHKLRPGVIPCLVYFISLIPSNCEWMDIKKKLENSKCVCVEQEIYLFKCVNLRLMEAEYGWNAICNGICTLVVSFVVTF